MTRVSGVGLQIIPADWLDGSADFEARLMRAGLKGTPIITAERTSSRGVSDSVPLDELVARLASATALSERLIDWMSSSPSSQLNKALRCNYACPIVPTAEEALAALAALLARSVHLDPARRVPVEVLLQLGDEGAEAVALWRRHLASGAIATHAAVDRMIELATTHVTLMDSAPLAKALAPRPLDPVDAPESRAPTSPSSMTGLVGACMAGDAQLDAALVQAARSGFTSTRTPFATRFALVAEGFPSSPAGRAAALIDVLALYREPGRPSKLRLDELQSDLGPSIGPVLARLTELATARGPVASSSFHREVISVYGAKAGVDAMFREFVMSIGAASLERPAPSTAKTTANTTASTTAKTTAHTTTTPAFGLERAAATATMATAAVQRAIGAQALVPRSLDANEPTLSGLGATLSMGGGAALAIVKQALTMPTSSLGKLLTHDLPRAAHTDDEQAAVLARLLWRYRDPADATRIRWSALRADAGVEGQALFDALQKTKARTPSTRHNVWFLAAMLEQLRVMAPSEARAIADVMVRASGLIPTSLPTLEAVAAHTKKGCLRGKGLCAVQHLFPTLVPLVEACIAKGMAPKDIHILGTPYATNPLVAAYLRLLGVQVTEARDHGHTTRGFEEARVKEIGTFLHSVVHSASRPTNGWKILDDGGLLQGTIAGHKTIDGLGLDPAELMRVFPADRCEAVEQTTRGLTELDKNPILYPTVAVARCPGKRQEGDVIGWSLADALLHELRQMGRLDDVRQITVVSAGTVGRATAQHLQDAGFDVTIVDVDPNKRAAAKEAGFAVAAQIKETLPTADLIFSCTGKTALDGETLRHWHGLIASGSSAAIEFNREQIDAMRSTKIEELNRGRPLNFNGDGYENVSTEQIGITRALLFCALTQPCDRTPGLIEVDDELEEVALRAWRRCGGDETVTLRRDAPRSQAGTRPDNDSGARHDAWMTYLSSLPAAVSPPPNQTGFAKGVYFFADGDHVRVVDTKNEIARSVVVDIPAVPRRVYPSSRGGGGLVELRGDTQNQLAAYTLSVGDATVTRGPFVDRLMVEAGQARRPHEPSATQPSGASLVFEAGTSLVQVSDGVLFAQPAKRAFGNDSLVALAPLDTLFEIRRSPPALHVHTPATQNPVAAQLHGVRIPEAFSTIDALVSLDTYGNFALVGTDRFGCTMVSPLASNVRQPEITRLPAGAVFRGMHRPDPERRPFWFAVDFTLPGDPVESEHFRQVEFSLDWGRAAHAMVTMPSEVERRASQNPARPRPTTRG